MQTPDPAFQPVFASIYLTGWGFAACSMCAQCVRCTTDGAYTHRCRGCDRMFYCSAACAEAAVRLGGHEQICTLVRRLMAHKADEHTKSLMLLALLVVQRASLEETLPPEPELEPELAAVPSWVPTYADVRQLQSHAEAWTEDEVQDWRYVLMRVWRARAHGAAGADGSGQRGRRGSDLRKSERFLVKLLQDGGLPFAEPSAFRLLSALESNCFGIWPGKDETYGRALYPTAAFFNHSCAPNCESVQLGARGIMDVVVREPVAAGTELCIHYIDCNVPVSARRRELLSTYRFVCMCDRCVHEAASPHHPKQTYARSVNHHNSRPRPPRKVVGRARTTSASSQEHSNEDDTDDQDIRAGPTDSGSGAAPAVAQASAELARSTLT